MDKQMFDNLAERVGVENYPDNQKRFCIKCDNFVQADKVYKILLAAGLKNLSYESLPNAIVHVVCENTKNDLDYVLRHIAVLQKTTKV